MPVHNPNGCTEATGLQPSRPAVVAPGCLPTRAGGISLVEVIVVLALIALAGSIALTPMLDWRHGMRLHAAVNEIRTDLTLARMRAVKENMDVAVWFDPSAGQYRVTYTDPGGNAVLVKAHAFPPGVRIAVENPAYTLDGWGHQAVFSARGTARPGTLVLANARGVTRQIVINFLGRVDVR
jgi:type II secretory pathway pseudopilin PulG